MALCSKIYKLRQTKLCQFVYFSYVLREQEETKNKDSAPHTAKYLEPITKNAASVISWLSSHFAVDSHHSLLNAINLVTL